LWGTLEEKLYANNLYSVEELQANITHEISIIPVQQFRHASRHIFSRHETWLEAEDLQFETTKRGTCQMSDVSAMGTTLTISSTSCIKVIKTIHIPHCFLNLRTEQRFHVFKNKVPKMNT
jgi:hypothetical protein